MARPFKYTPDKFKKAWEEYFAWCDANPWYKKEAIKSGDLAGTLVDIPIGRPYTEIGFCAYHNLGERYLYELEETLKKHNDKEAKELSTILTQAKAKCYAQKLEGAAVGAYNANIIARLLGLADKQEQSGPNGQPIAHKHEVIFKHMDGND